MADTRTPELAASDALAKALDFVKAQQTPNDGGQVEAAIEVLRGLVASPQVQQQVQQKMAAMQAPAQAQPAKPEVVTPANPNPAPQGGIQPADAGQGQADASTTGQANTPGV